MKGVVALALLSVPSIALAAGTFSVSSAEVKPNAPIAEAQVYKGFGCDGGNVSPSLAWKNAPAGTKSLQSPCTTPMRRRAAAGGIG